MPESSHTQTRHDQHGYYPQSATVNDFRHNLRRVHSRIDAPCLRVGRDLTEVHLLPVSKTKPEAILSLAYVVDGRSLSENKVQAAFNKWEMMQDLTDLHWSIIGYVQADKSTLVARFASEFQVLDSLRVAETLERRLKTEGRGLDVFVQVNTSGETSKYGLSPEDVLSFTQKPFSLQALRVRGLITLALFSDNAKRVFQCFILLRTSRHQLRQSVPSSIRLDKLSMSMHGDFEIAIDEATTVVRVRRRSLVRAQRQTTITGRKQQWRRSYVR